MRLTLTDTQSTLAEASRAFLAKHASPEALRRMEASDTGFDDSLWQRIVALGWTGVPFDEEATDLSHLTVVLNEIGRAALASPYFQSVVAAGVTAHRLGDNDLAREIVERIEGGARAALVAPANPASIATAESAGNGTLRVSGGEYIIEWADSAEVLVVPIRTADDEVMIVALDPDQPGLTITSARGIDHERLGRVRLEDVTVDEGRALTSRPLPMADLDEHLALIRLLRAAECAGGAASVLDFTVDYVGTRRQFGTEIGRFQAVQHMCADMAMEADAAYLATWEAITMAELGLPFRDRASMATFVAGRAYERVTQSSAQLHGGMGFMAEYHLQFYFRRAKTLRQRLGSTPFQLEEIARHVVDQVVETGSFPTRQLVVADA